MIYQKGDKIAGYTVTFPHKRGVYAETYRVKDTTGKTRFLKLMDYGRMHRSQIDEDGNIVEVEVAKKCAHRNLCSYVDSGNIVSGAIQYGYLVTEYISGETLLNRLSRDGMMSVYEIKQIARAVLSALSCLHSCTPVPVVHGEVTIENVMLNLAGDLADLKLIDLGSARFVNQKPVKPNMSRQHLFYLAPEQFAGVYRVQSDIYAVGVMIYQLLFGRLPWFIDLSGVAEENVVDVILEEREKDLQIPSTKNIFELDDQFINTMLKALNYDAEDRFNSAVEFIKAIDGEMTVETQKPKKKIISGDDGHRLPKLCKLHKGEGFGAIAGMDDLKAQMMEEVIEPLNNPDEYRKYGVTIPNGMLLYGPPGCGKTFFAKHFAEEVGFNFMCITPATLKSRYVNATQENIANMFKEAEENAPTIIFIDEINELVPNRESDVHEMSKSAVNEMLAQMDRTGERGIFIIGATNYPDMIDPAILRAGRMDKKYYIGPPDRIGRAALFKLYLEKRPCDFGLDYEKLADMTDNYVSADIQLIVNDAARNALKRKSKITMELLSAAIEEVRPSVSTSEISRYDEVRCRMEGKFDDKKKHPSIGFK